MLLILTLLTVVSAVSADEKYAEKISKINKTTICMTIVCKINLSAALPQPFTRFTFISMH